MIDRRDSYASSLIFCLKSRMDGKGKVPSSLEILHEVCRIIASEWIVVNAYLERDLNSIEWRLEQLAPDLHTLEFFLRQLYIMRRRIRKYRALLSDQLLWEPPRSFQSPPASDNVDLEVSKAINADFKQAKELICRSNDRIKETVELITSVMSVLEAKESNTQNQGIMFLTFVATVALAFNVFAAVFGMNSENGPSNPKGWREIQKWVLITIAITFSCYVLMFTGFWVRNLRARSSTK